MALEANRGTTLKASHVIYNWHLPPTFGLCLVCNAFGIVITTIRFGSKVSCLQHQADNRKRRLTLRISTNNRQTIECLGMVDLASRSLDLTQIICKRPKVPTRSNQPMPSVSKSSSAIGNAPLSMLKASPVIYNWHLLPTCPVSCVRYLRHRCYSCSVRQ